MEGEARRGFNAGFRRFLRERVCTKTKGDIGQFRQTSRPKEDTYMSRSFSVRSSLLSRPLSLAESAFAIVAPSH